jgi:hypothetical protein
MCSLQSALAEITAQQFCQLPVRLGVAGLLSRLRMAKVIEFYRPSNFRKDAKITPQERGKVIEFRVLPKKSA